ncbi:MAG: hypothetical protein ACFFE2_15870 [Candidatus Thorarchaeota archaeon]
MQELLTVLPLPPLFDIGFSSGLALLVLGYREDLRVFARRIRNNRSND